MTQIKLETDLKNKSSEIESKLDEADLLDKADSTRYTHEEVFSDIRNQIKTRQK